LFFVPQLAATIIPPDGYLCSLFWFFVLHVIERARAASKQDHMKNKEPEQATRLFWFFVPVILYFDRILFPSNPIHELRLDLNVANTVIALTIRVI